jgi:hypothetical protein
MPSIKPKLRRLDAIPTRANAAAYLVKSEGEKTAARTADLARFMTLAKAMRAKKIRLRFMAA